MDIDEPLKRIANPENIVDRISGTAPTSASIISASDIALDTGDLIVGNLVSPAPGVEVMDPTSTDFTGTFVTGEGATFNGSSYNFGGVSAGVLQAGMNQDDGTMVAGAGKVVLDVNGVNIYDSTDTTAAKIRFLDEGTGTVDAQIMFNNNDTAPPTKNLYLKNAPASTDYGCFTLIWSAAKPGNRAMTQITASDDTFAPVSPTISLISSSSTPPVTTIWINSEVSDVDTIISSDGITNMLYVDAALDAVGIGAAPTTTDSLQVTGNIKVGMGAAVSVLDHGTYTPTLTNVTNVGASTAYSCQYMRVGTVVTVSGRVDINPTAAGVATQLGISVPVASNFANPNELGGTAVHSGASGYSASLQADATNNRARLDFLVPDAINRAWFFTFTYRII